MNTNIVLMKEWHGWKKQCYDGVNIWFKGYLINSSVDQIYIKIHKYIDRPVQYPELSEWINTLNGHFALVIETKKWIFASVDKIRSIPLFYAKYESGVLISNHAPELINKTKKNKEDINLTAATEIMMSGFTEGRITLYKDIFQITAGEFLLVHKDYSYRRIRYYRYSPWNIVSKSTSNLESELSEILIRTITNMAESVNGRQIVIPLSAGNDSRFIASALKHIGYDNVHCFSYGSSDNYEMNIAKQVANKLNYSWEPIVVSIKTQKKLFASGEFYQYLNFSDTLSSSPVLIDFNAIKQLSRKNHIAKNAVFVNGNAGDFITGGHISRHNSERATKHAIAKEYIKKHYSLWYCRKSCNDINLIESRVNAIDSLMDEFNVGTELLWAIGESMEWLGRQSKFVTTTQRSYEFFGYDWRLPLWDPILMDFWEGVPLHYKLDQNLYHSTLKKNNWGGVWSEFPVNKYKINSFHLNMFRTIVKASLCFTGKKLWHKIDKRVFSYFYDTSVAVAYVPYLDVLFDQCGARNRNSWISRKYLHRHGFDMLDMRHSGQKVDYNQ